MTVKTIACVAMFATLSAAVSATAQTNLPAMGATSTSASSQKSVGDDKANIKIEMVFVKGGTFRMGCTQEQGSIDCWDSERPVHTVTLSSYHIGKYEVTQGLWKAVMGSLPSSLTWSSPYGYGDEYPVYYVRWNDVAGKDGFIEKLNNKTGKKYRLPTEAEWEYAARGGASSGGYKYSGSNNIDDIAWYWYNIPSQSFGTSGYGTQPVGTKKANELGIYDMNGNVWEWVNDWYGDYRAAAQTNPKGPASGSERVFRGGNWELTAGYCRVSNRNNDRRGHAIGFRLVLPP